MSESEIGSVKNGVSENEGVIADNNYRPVRNVQTQHGDYRTVDEENIVVLPLSRCDSPEPPPQEIDETVWIEPFAEENQVSVNPIGVNKSVRYLKDLYMHNEKIMLLFLFKIHGQIISFCFLKEFAQNKFHKLARFFTWVIRVDGSLVNIVS